MRQNAPSRTARKVALNIISLGSKKGMETVLPPGIVEATAALLVESGAVGKRAVHFCRSQTAVGIYLAFDWMMPGQFEAFAHRKAFFENQVRKGIEANAGQVLILGAGYDTLGWRLAPEYPEVGFFEIDHPATMASKVRGIEAMGRRANHHLIAEDLSKRQLQDVLAGKAEWDMGLPSIFVAEGLFMYLPPAAVGDAFEQCAAISAAGSRIVFTYAGRRADGRLDAGPWSRLVLWLLKVGGEPWLWGIRPDDLAAFVKQHNWTVAEDPEATVRHGVELFGLADK